MKLTYDRERNIAYLRLRPKGTEVETIQVNDEVNVDIAPDGSVYGIELLNAKFAAEGGCVSDGTNDPEAVAAARGVLDRHFAALNAGDAAALAATLHFPHYRLAGGRMQVWQRPDNYLADFHSRAGDGWHHSTLDICEPIASSPDKVHFDVAFTRYRADGSMLGRYRSLWVVSLIDGRWAAQLRSSFAG